MSDREELAAAIATKLDTLFGRPAGQPATQDYELAEHLIREGWTRSDRPA